MIITATEFKSNIGKYLALADKEDILITKNGKSVARLTHPSGSKTSVARQLRGVLKGEDWTLASIREERLSKHDETVD